ncbi:multiprotein-bridging factor 1 family protein [Streptomyces sp. NPDC058092]|uniref:helix-turn-helix domain-containing protein n=1 Tax=Streptomyces sp. NPDC058092 TaxID=3346336 RepID=UPI0036E37F79
MPQPKYLDPYTDARSFYGSELRRLREAAGMSRSELGDKVFCSGTYIGLFEDAALVAQYRSAYDLARAVALSPEASLALIASAAEDCDR